METLVPEIDRPTDTLASIESDVRTRNLALHEWLTEFSQTYRDIPVTGVTIDLPRFEISSATIIPNANMIILMNQSSQAIAAVMR